MHGQHLRQTIMSQYDGLAAGYSAMAPAAEALSAAQFMYLQMDGDMETVKDMLGAQGMLGVHPRLAPNRADHSTRPLLSSRCSVLVRVTDDDVFMGHDTWDGYEAMLRVFKHYTVSLTRGPCVRVRERRVCDAVPHAWLTRLMRCHVRCHAAARSTPQDRRCRVDHRVVLRHPRLPVLGRRLLPELQRPVRNRDHEWLLQHKPVRRHPWHW